MKISEHGKRRLHILYEPEDIDLHVLKACWTLTIQTVTEHRNASTDRRCEYLNSYLTVQHRSFRKPCFLDPQSSRLDPRISKLDPRILKLELRDVRIESRVSNFKCQLTFERYCRCHYSVLNKALGIGGNKELRQEGQCVVPENIHTPPTEDSLICTPPTPQDFPFQGGLWWPPPSPRNFQNFQTATSSCQSGFGT